MRARSLSLAVALLVPALVPAGAQAATPITKRSLLSLSGLGAIGIGIKVSTAERRTGQDLHYRSGDIAKGCGSGQLTPKALGVTVLGTDFRIGYIAVSKRGIKTPSGIRVGDSLAKLGRAYGKRLVDVPNAFDVHETDFEYRDGDRKLVFFVDPRTRKVKAMRTGRKPEVDYVEGCA